MNYQIQPPTGPEPPAMEDDNADWLPPLKIHGNKKPVPAIIRPIGPSIAYVPISRGLFSLIEIEDADWAERWRWYAIKFKNTGDFRAARKIATGVRRSKTILMHSDLFGWAGHEWTVDHIRPKTGLDNRRHGNLRKASKSEQSHNQVRAKHNTSGFKGVSFYTRDKVWAASIGVNRRKIHLGRYSTPEEAHAVYCAAAKRLYGEFGRGA